MASGRVFVSVFNISKANVLTRVIDLELLTIAVGIPDLARMLLQNW